MKLYGAYLLSLLSFTVSVLRADRITVHNKTPRDLNIGIYYLHQGNAQRVGELRLLENDSSGIFERPARKFGYDRELAFAEYSALLPEQLTERELKRLHSKNIGMLQGDSFYIADENGRLEGYNTIEWNVVNPLVNAAHQQVLQSLPAVQANPFVQKQATIRVGDGVPAQEEAFLNARRVKVKNSLEKLLGKPLQGKYIPKIALVCSGGGYRAMLYATGSIYGAYQANFLDSLTYAVGLSGSSWALGVWMATGFAPQKFIEYVIDRAAVGIASVGPRDATLIAQMLATKYMFSQPITMADIYGALLANTLFDYFGDLKQQVHLSDQARRVNSGAMPLPIYTAIRGETALTENQWYEFTPYEVGGRWLHCWVPSWGYGRKFIKGSSVHYAPEQSFGFLLGTYGLALGITVDRLIDESGLMKNLDGFSAYLVNQLRYQVGTLRLLYAQVFNFSRGIEQSPIARKRTMKLVDAGIGFNLPYPAISGESNGRKADIIIFMDASGGAIPQELVKTENYARQQGLKFPAIDYTDLNKHAVSVFKDESDPETPVVIYIPRIVDTTLLERVKNNNESLKDYVATLEGFDVEQCISKEACNTFNFHYTKQEAQRLVALGAFNIQVEIERIKEVIDWVIEKKSVPDS